MARSNHSGAKWVETEGGNEEPRWRDGWEGKRGQETREVAL